MTGVSIKVITDNNAVDGTMTHSEHGLSILVERKGKKVLFDTGQTPSVFLHNTRLLNIPHDFDAHVVSHGHYDHTGYLEGLVREHPCIPIFAHPAIFERKGVCENGRFRYIGIPGNIDFIRGNAELHLSREPVEVVSGIYTTGEIPRIESSLNPRFCIYKADGTGTVIDPLSDDQALVVRTEAGLVVVLGCCHAGVINTLEFVRKRWGTNIYAVMGGMHLRGADNRTLSRISDYLKEISPELIVPMHCTGENAFRFFRKEIGTRVRNAGAGLTLKIGTGVEDGETNKG